ncbi:MAG: nitrite reductase, copper-containing [Chloroflexi bacterium]|nr:nitrite reductase, copper-containing [Chloroflexota bacterium]
MGDFFRAARPFVHRGLLALVALVLGALAFGVACATAAPQGSATPTAVPVDLAFLPMPQVPPPLARTTPASVKINLEAREIDARLDEGVGFTYWTFNGTVPGEFLRVREGDTVELTLKNAASSKSTHSIDLHAVNGPGGGAAATSVDPGKERTFTFKALNPGLYVYHCATPIIPHHIMQGMYGLILVEPKEGLAPMDREFYVMQGDIYTKGNRGDKGMQSFDLQELLSEDPDYVVFNGAVGSIVGDRALKAKVGETVRIFFGVGGPNLPSSFHVIGEIFDTVYPEAALADPLEDVQTTLVPTGGATMVEFKLEVPGRYILVDHSLGRLLKGAAGFLEVEGPEAPEIFQGGSGGSGSH